MYATRNTSFAENGVSARYAPDSLTSALPFCSRSANLISAGSVPPLPALRPMKRSVPASGTVNSTYPSPEEICCAEIAPASGHPPHPPAFMRLLPIVEAFTTSVQLTGAAAPPVYVGAGVGAGSDEGGAVTIGPGSDDSGAGMYVDPESGAGAPDPLAPRRS